MPADPAPPVPQPPTEWVTVPCTNRACRGLRMGVGFPVTVPKGHEKTAECNECFSR